VLLTHTAHHGVSTGSRSLAVAEIILSAGIEAGECRSDVVVVVLRRKKDGAREVRGSIYRVRDNDDTEAGARFSGSVISDAVIS
jgi:hypothetical protein